MTTLGILSYNEEKNIESVINNYADIFEKIIIINDGSKDETFDILEKLKKEYKNLSVVNNSKNLGAGRSLEICINQFLETKDEYLIKIDGDNQFKKEDVLKLKKIIENEKFDFIKCDRFWDGGIEGNIPNVRYFGNAFASLLAKFSTGNWKVNDPLNGLFAFSKRSLKDFNLPKLFYRYGYPFYIVTFMMNQSIEKNHSMGQYKNTIKYIDNKKTLNPIIIFLKLIWFSITNYYSKIKRKLKYSSLQISSLLDIFSQLFLFLSFFSIYKFFNIRYFDGIGPQGSWFIVFIIFFSFFMFLLFFSLNEENNIAMKNFKEIS